MRTADMHLAAYRLRNFRRLQDVRVDLEHDVSVFVGSNNSGKTSATMAVRMFVAGSKQAFSIHDFCAACWQEFEAIGSRNDSGAPLPKMSLDLWFHVSDADAYRVIDLLPSLDWNGQRVGIRIEFSPRDQVELLANYRSALAEANVSANAAKRGRSYSPWPRTLVEYLEKKLTDAYMFRYYALDATKFDDDLVTTSAIDEGTPLLEHGEASGKNVVASLIHVDFLNAQRPLSADEGARTAEDLSQRLSRYYQRLKPCSTDHTALQALAESEQNLNDHFSAVFKPTMDSLQKLGYPGLDNPQLSIKTDLNPEQLLARHGSGARVHYSLPGIDGITLPDRYNGLGFKNLIYMVIELLEMHTAWENMGSERPPVHLVFVEEPEAHLHTQLQQVFIAQIMKIPALEVLLPYSRQLVVTTHSPHILYQRGFQPVRYFRRQQDQTSQVLNLTNFERDTERTEVAFLRKYVKLTHCDLFFADAAVLVEGNVERLLLPLMIERSARELASSHLSIIEIGGAFAHRFRRLLEFLGIPVLIITDLDSVDGSDRRKKCRPLVEGAVTSNPILSGWLPCRTNVSDLIAATEEERTSPRQAGAKGRIHVTYQRYADAIWKDSRERRASRTLEEAFGLENLTWSQRPGNEALGLLIEGNETMDVDTLAERLFTLVASGDFKKTDFALALLSSDDGWIVPDYIATGLGWLNDELKGRPASDETAEAGSNELKPSTGAAENAPRKSAKPGRSKNQLELPVV